MLAPASGTGSSPLIALANSEYEIDPLRSLSSRRRKRANSGYESAIPCLARPTLNSLDETLPSLSGFMRRNNFRIPPLRSRLVATRRTNALLFFPSASDRLGPRSPPAVLCYPVPKKGAGEPHVSRGGTACFEFKCDSSTRESSGFRMGRYGAA